MNINEKIRHIVRNVINEELGINSLVTKATDEIISMVSNGECELRDIPMGKNHHVPYKAANIDYEFANGQMIRLNVGMYDFHSADDMFGYKKEYPQEYRKMVNASTRQTDEWSKITVTFNIVRVGGEVEASSYNALQHELEHSFQRIMSGKNTLVKDQGKYSKNIGIMSDNTVDKYVKNAARINYYSYKHEQDAFGNGLYSEIKHSNPTVGNIDTLIKGSKFYGVLTRLKKVVNEFSILNGEDRVRVDAMLKEKFGYGVDTVIKRGMKNVDEFVYRMGRVKTLIIKQITN